MKTYINTNVPRARRAVAVGIFDGVHRGHARILSQLIAEARRVKGRAAVVTFDPHPLKVLRPRLAQPILMSLPHRLRSFEKLGVDDAVVLRFDRSFARRPRERFLEEMLLRRLGMRTLIVGHDFRFGRGASGDAAYLRSRTKELGFTARFVRPLKAGGSIVSSTRIRRLIERGRLAAASRMLGRRVSLYGTVVRGRGRGAEMGFPTANLDPHHETLPPAGVYAAWGELGKKKLRAVIHIGERPTFGDTKSVEAHFLDFKGDLYGREIELEFVSRLRNVKRFNSKKSLSNAIASDIRRARRILR